MFAVRYKYVQRFLSSESGIENNFLETGNVNESQWQPLSVAIAALSEQQIFINDESCPSLNQMGAMRFCEVLKPRTEIGYFGMRSQRNKPGFIENMAM
ncbi:MAG: DnaB-like helicase C-terminal domain-containing protein [Nostoc sp.]|uniref:DnaB-like helicase C-terminal domain-containing protein n=1 Tax=Nostoc sp. TaxID=1180 RepID=UPI002FF8A60F